jgi:hypothetical protein
MNQQQLEQRQDEIAQLEAQLTTAQAGAEALRAAVRDADKAAVELIGDVARAKRLLRVDILLQELDQEVVRLARYAMTRFKAVKRLAEHNNLMSARHTVEMAIEHGTLKREHGEYALLCAVAEILNYDQAAASSDARDAAWRLKIIMSRQIVHDNELKRIQQQGVQA